jgi:hypothetical protein
MSKISTIADNIRTRVTTILPTHKILPNNRIIEENDTLYLSKGQAVSLGPGLNTNRLTGCKLSIQRTATVTITRAHFGVDRDTAVRNTLEKDLLEDQFLIIQDLEKDPDLDGTTARMVFLADNGIEEIFVEQGHFLMIQTTFEFEYLENLT